MSVAAPEILEENERLKTENKVLSLRVKALEKELFGRRSDKRPEEDPGQGKLDGIEEDTTFEEPDPEPSRPSRKPERKGKKKGPKPLNPDLPRILETVSDPDLKDLICPVTGKMMKAAFTEKIEVLARKPAEYYVREIIRKVFASPGGDAVCYSPWPADVLSKSRIDVSLIAAILTGRFADHQPYHRQCQQLARHGIDLAPNTLVSLVRQAWEKLEPLCKAIIAKTLSHNYIMMDPTPVPLMSAKKSGSTKEATLWTYRALDGPVFFEFADGKYGTTPAITLEHYQGRLQTDGASNFGGVPSRPGVIHLNCWSHARRYFVKAADAGEPEAAAYLDEIDRLFYIERVTRRFNLSAEMVMKLRERHSQPLLDSLFARAKTYAQNEPMIKTPMPKAITYLLKREKELRECFRHAPSRIDNNLAENALRPIKLGAKNWLFIGHEHAGPRAAMMFTIVENCRLAGANPEAYFADVLRRIDDHPASRIDELIPQNWVKSKNT